MPLKTIIKKIFVISLFLSIFNPIVFGQSLFETGKVLENVKSLKYEGQSFSVYLPKNYDKTKKWPVIYAFDAAARGSLAVKLFSESAEKYGYIVVGSNNSRNYDNKIIQQSAQAMFDEIPTFFSIDQNRVYTTGFSGGARIALFFAVKLKNIKGVIACGSGYHPDDKPTEDDNYTFIGIIGNLDSNYSEMMNIENDMETLKMSHKIIVFNGIHQWPPSKILNNAVEKLELDAMKKGFIVKKEKFIDYLFYKELDNIVALKKNILIIDTYLKYKQILNDFNGLKNTKKLEIEFETFINQNHIHKKIAEYKKILENEDAIIHTYMRKSWFIQSKKYKLNNKINDLRFFKNEVKQIEKNIKHEKNPLINYSNQRLLDFIYRHFFEIAYVQHIDKNYDKATVLYEISLMAKKDNNIGLYNLACLYSLKGKNKQAIKFLEKAILYGFNKKELILSDPDLNNIKNDKKFLNLIYNIH